MYVHLTEKEYLIQRLTESENYANRLHHDLIRLSKHSLQLSNKLKDTEEESIQLSQQLEESKEQSIQLYQQLQESKEHSIQLSKHLEESKYENKRIKSDSNTKFGILEQHILSSLKNRKDSALKTNNIKEIELYLTLLEEASELPFMKSIKNVLEEEYAPGGLGSILAEDNYNITSTLVESSSGRKSKKNK